MATGHFLAKLSIGILWAASAWGQQQYTISTFAGTNVQGFSGDSGAPASAQLGLPGRIALDSSGKIYFADGANNRVRLISGGTITTYAGNGTAGFAGDGSAATNAKLNDPIGLALDSSGNLYIADAGNNAIRKVTTSGTISTIAGNNTAGYSGDGGAATSAQLNDPVAVAVDTSGNVYIADANNFVIRMISGTTISTIVGGAATPFTQLNHPDGLALGPGGILYIADTGNKRIAKFANGALTSFAGNGTSTFAGDNGPAINASLNDPVGVAVDAAGNVYIADTFHNRIRKVSSSGIITTIAGNGTAFYSGDGGAATNATLFFPHDVAIDSSGNVYVADTSNNVIRLLTPQTPVLSANGVVNAATFLPKVSPGALASIFGTNFASGNISATGSTLPTVLGPVSVTVNNRNAPLLFVSPTQVNFQVPWETGLGNATISVIVNGLISNSVSVPVLSAAPGLFVLPSGGAVVQNSDFTLNSPSNPAKSGSTIIAYLTGSGPVSPAVASGARASADPLSIVISSKGATIGSTAATVSFAGLAPGFVGLLQMNIVVPSTLAAGDYPLTITINGESSNSATISVSK
ncbi:MAG TPA: SMP-30/gluconolactonase/LRE family protein [Bryobacteraceae bacterium]